MCIKEFPYLQARSLIFASKFSGLASAEIARQYAAHSVTILESKDSGIPVKLSAVKAIRKYVNIVSCLDILTGGLDDSICEAHNDGVIGSEAARIAHVLGSLVLVTEDDTLTVVLDTFTTVLKVHDGSWLSTDLSASIAKAFLEAWSKNSKGWQFHRHASLASSAC